MWRGAALAVAPRPHQVLPDSLSRSCDLKWTLPSSPRRQLQNVHTGLDLSVPQHQEVRGKMLSGHVEYQILVVTRLAAFKSAKHKPEDAVQFLAHQECAFTHADSQEPQDSADRAAKPAQEASVFMGARCPVYRAAGMSTLEEQGSSDICPLPGTWGPQLSVSKKYSDIEEFYQKLSRRYAAASLPPLPRKVLFVGESDIRERRAMFSEILHCVAKDVQLAGSPELLEFLGPSLNSFLTTVDPLVPWERREFSRRMSTANNRLSNSEVGSKARPEAQRGWDRMKPHSQGFPCPLLSPRVVCCPCTHAHDPGCPAVPAAAQMRGRSMVAAAEGSGALPGLQGRGTRSPGAAGVTSRDTGGQAGHSEEAFDFFEQQDREASVGLPVLGQKSESEEQPLEEEEEALDPLGILRSKKPKKCPKVAVKAKPVPRLTIFDEEEEDGPDAELFGPGGKLSWRGPRQGAPPIDWGALREDGTQHLGAEGAAAAGASWGIGHTLKLFDDPDLGGPVPLGDPLLLPAACGRAGLTTSLDGRGGSAELFRVEEDLDQILNLGAEPTPKPKPPVAEKPALPRKPAVPPRAAPPEASLTQQRRQQQVQAMDEVGILQYIQDHEAQAQAPPSLF
ncbi:HCLS1-binding protein 3 [Heterocephalus glaber]|uniref:HCLS1-binding protein 3 n=1 Tax=Heterocephalus glaber TaxID=10181 RepID=G5AZC0_HETGA|nr:HCLS1-binding protein 3 [Heterocephalus glaber]